MDAPNRDSSHQGRGSGIMGVLARPLPPLRSRRSHREKTHQLPWRRRRGSPPGHGRRARLSSQVSLDPVYIVRADAPVPGKAAVLSGGGSGHEPMHGGFVAQACWTRRAPARCSHPRRPTGTGGNRGGDGGAGVLVTSSRTTPATCSILRWPPTWRVRVALRWRPC